MHDYWILRIRPLDEFQRPICEIAYEVPGEVASLLWQNHVNQAAIILEGKTSLIVPKFSNLISHTEQSRGTNEFKIGETTPP